MFALVVKQFKLSIVFQDFIITGGNPFAKDFLAKPPKKTEDRREVRIQQRNDNLKDRIRERVFCDRRHSASVSTALNKRRSMLPDHFHIKSIVKLVETQEFGNMEMLQYGHVRAVGHADIFGWLRLKGCDSLPFN